MRAFAREPRVVEELSQEVFVEAYFSLRNYRGDGEFAAWLNRIATRVGYQYWRQRKRRSRETVYGKDWWQAIAKQPEERLDPARAAELVRVLLDQLPPRDRLVLLLLHVENRSIAEAARLAGWSQTMIRVQAFRARAKLRALLAKAGVRHAEDVAGLEAMVAGKDHPRYNKQKRGQQ
jgi:RNA polymerase sigma-70 factor (ECF subfamily)